MMAVETRRSACEEAPLQLPALQRHGSAPTLQPEAAGAGLRLPRWREDHPEKGELGKPP